jgi:hypothetical protein
MCPSFHHTTIEGLSESEIINKLSLLQTPGTTIAIDGHWVGADDLRAALGPQPTLLKGHEIFIATLKQGCPLWLANPLLWLGCLALMARQWRWAAFAGLIAVVLGVPSRFTGHPSAAYLAEHDDSERLLSGITVQKLPSPTLLAGYGIWLASMVLLAGGGFYGWWSSRRQGQAKDFKTTLPEIKPPPLGLDRDLDGS